MHVCHKTAICQSCISMSSSFQIYVIVVSFSCLIFFALLFALYSPLHGVFRLYYHSAVNKSRLPAEMIEVFRDFCWLFLSKQNKNLNVLVWMNLNEKGCSFLTWKCTGPVYTKLLLFKWNIFGRLSNLPCMCLKYVDNIYSYS